MSRNALDGETSPYLLQHKDNPVHWQAWGPAALARAQAEDKPILLSVGYAACHWCHVMAAESFVDPAIAALMNAHFVCIKVDREERPDLDTIYQHALAMMGEPGGWPLTMFLTPAGEPFWGGTYFPPAARWGRPGFPEVLRAIAAAWQGKRDEIATNVAALTAGLARLAQPQAGAGISRALIDQAALRLLDEVDTRDGGLGTAPKFPQAPLFTLLWRGARRLKSAPLRDAVRVTLDHIAQGGIYDHLGGGFARYSVDARWLVPHFEKMLYDNALLIELLTAVWQETKAPLYAQRIAETIGWVEREMRAQGGFAASLDADSEHEEGKFYVWSAAEIDRVLGADAARFKAFYDVRAEGNWDGRTILNRLDHIALADDATEAALAAARAQLLTARATRVRPARDDKVLADWNGLMIAALATAGAAFGRSDWIARAAEAFAFIKTTLGADGDRLVHAWRAGRRREHAVLDDYAAMSRAALALHAATGTADYLAAARRWVAVCDRDYWDAAGGGYFFTAADGEALLVRTKQAVDAPNPSGNGMLAEVLARLYYLTGETAYRDRAEALLAAFAGEPERNLFGLASLLNGAELLLRAQQIVIVGAPASADTRALAAAADAASLPTKIIARVAPGTPLPAGHPAAGKGMIAGRAAAYLCEGPVCSPPITDPAALATALARL